ncbi:hypothetical protein [Ornithinimicrobium sp. Y1694]|uniref:hypothetical protein n=1 Tax=Ornithinimicrobium sp. Y1694 TaxID=3418590 RepID=UPI003CF899AA
MSDEDADYAEDLDLEDQPAADPAGSVRDPTIAGLPDGYRYGVTRYADIIMSQAFPDRWADLVNGG